mmetsp:Transcript_37189/g.93356  ORF Transcript_37189/g.93356 Transcript_37189/m.93356 type:complete len:242 (-) Transcript_37189:227-952(-)
MVVAVVGHVSEKLLCAAGLLGLVSLGDSVLPRRLNLHPSSTTGTIGRSGLPLAASLSVFAPLPSTGVAVGVHAGVGRLDSLGRHAGHVDVGAVGGLGRVGLVVLPVVCLGDTHLHVYSTVGLVVIVVVVCGLHVALYLLLDLVFLLLALLLGGLVVILGLVSRLLNLVTVLGGLGVLRPADGAHPALVPLAQPHLRWQRGVVFSEYLMLPLGRVTFVARLDPGYDQVARRQTPRTAQTQTR